jgi:hypothetical protein
MVTKFYLQIGHLDAFATETWKALEKEKAAAFALDPDSIAKT